MFFQFQRTFLKRLFGIGYICQSAVQLIIYFGKKSHESADIILCSELLNHEKTLSRRIVIKGKIDSL